MGACRFLRQFIFTKFAIVVDKEVNIRYWQYIIRLISTHVDQVREFTILENIRFNIRFFASPVSGSGSKVVIDDPNQLPGEKDRDEVH